MISDREFQVNIMSDELERLYRKNHLFPSVTDLCAFCLGVKDRRVLKMVKPGLGYKGEHPACRECIEKHGLEISDSKEAIEYDAITNAIMKIREQKKEA